MTTNITELAQSLKAAAEKATSGEWAVQFGDEVYVTNDDVGYEQVAIATLDASDADYIALANPANVKQLVEALEKAQPAQPCEHSMFWDASGVRRCSKCDIPEHANVHYADAAEMEIAALRQRITELEEAEKKLCAANVTLDARAELAERLLAELESRTVKLPKPHAHLIWIQAGHAPDDYWDDVAVSHSEKDRCCDGSERYPVYAHWEIEEALTAAGIKWEAE